MGLFDAIFGTNTSQSTQDAARAAELAYQGAQANGSKSLYDTTTAGNQALNRGATSAIDALTRSFGEGANALSGYGQTAQGALGVGIDNAARTALAGNTAYAPFAAAGSGASGLLSDALGVNGAVGDARATAAFQAAPGYQFQVDQATDAAQRAAAKAGMDASGNTLDAVSRLGSQLANTGFQSYLTNLTNLGGQGLTAAEGQSGNDRSAASLYGTGATTGAGLLQNTGSSLGALDQALGTAQGSVYAGLGGNLSSNDTSLGRNLANLGLQTAQGVANAELTAGQAQDKADNANSGIFSNLFKNVGSGLLSGGLSGALKGFF